MRYVKREYAFFDALSRSGNDMQMYDRVKDVLKQMLLGQAARVGAELSYSGIPRDYALEILVSAVSSIIWLWIRRGCKEAPEQICAIIEKNKTNRARRHHTVSAVVRVGIWLPSLRGVNPQEKSET